MSTSGAMEQRVEAVLARLRPYIETDGIDAIVDRCEGETVYLRLTCPPVCCASQRVLTTLAVRHRIMKEIPDAREVVVL